MSATLRKLLSLRSKFSPKQWTALHSLQTSVRATKHFLLLVCVEPLPSSVEFSVLRKGKTGQIELHSLTEKEIADLLQTVDLSTIVTSEAS